MRTFDEEYHRKIFSIYMLMKVIFCELIFFQCFYPHSPPPPPRHVGICLSKFTKKGHRQTTHPRTEIVRARKRFQHFLLTRKPTTLTHSVQSTIPPNHHKVLGLSCSIYNGELYMSKFTKKCHSQTTPSSEWKQTGSENVFNTLC